MIINKFSFNIYMICILSSLLVAILYTFYHLKKDKIETRLIWLSVIMIVPYILVGGLLMTYLSSPTKDFSFIKMGLSSYGGAIGLIIAVFVFEKITQEKEIKYRYIISLPLIYSISKLGCFFAGCCYGIPYKGPLYVYYPNIIKEKLFPVQLLETLVFLIIFIIINHIYNKYKSNLIIEYTMISCSIAKFLLDFLRYSHINKTITLNQWISIIIFTLAIGLLIHKNNKKTIKNPK